jgi:hypothetical protein
MVGDECPSRPVRATTHSAALHRIKGPGHGAEVDAFEGDAALEIGDTGLQNLPVRSAAKRRSGQGDSRGPFLVGTVGAVRDRE